MFFFFNDTATTEIYTLSLHDALPISCGTGLARERRLLITGEPPKRAEDRERPNPNACTGLAEQDRKSTRLNSSHSQISYAVFCLKKKNKKHLGNNTTNTSIAVSHLAL